MRIDKDTAFMIFFLVTIVAIFVGNRYFSPLGKEHFSNYKNRYALIERTYLSGEALRDFVSENSKVATSKVVQKFDYIPNYGKIYTRLDILYDTSNGKRFDKEKIALLPKLQCNPCLNTRYSNDDSLTRTFSETSVDSGVAFYKHNIDWLKETGKSNIPVKSAFTSFENIYTPQRLNLEISGNVTPLNVDKYAILLTTYYSHELRTERAPLYWLKSQHSLILKCVGIACATLCFAILYLTYRDFGSRRNLSIGIFILLWSLINLYIWNVHYMIVSMSTIVISAIFILFSHQWGKMIYLIAAVFQTNVAYLTYSNTKEFVMKVAILYIVGVSLMLFINNDNKIQRITEDDI